MNRLVTLLVALGAACGEPAPDPLIPPPDEAQADQGFADAASTCPDVVTVGVRDTETLTGTEHCEIELRFDSPTIVEITASGAELTLDTAAPQDEPSWIAPRAAETGSAVLSIAAAGAWSVEVASYGMPVEPIRRERSLVWTDGALVDDPTLVGLGRMMRLAADGEAGGALFDWWLRRFATTAHSERVGPARFIAALQDEHGADPTQWDLDALPFRVTGVHNRLDLANGTHCGELRVSIASVHPEFQPFHAIFLFAQEPGVGDVSPGGRVHCGATARRWASLSALDDAAFTVTAGEWLDEALTSSTFLMAETVEFIISPWEWRQWRPAPNPDPGAEPARVLENPPLFQTLDVSRINGGGAIRADFLAFVSENAAELDARTVEFPERFRPQSARVNAGVPWIPLDLAGLDPVVTRGLPDLRRNLEIVGCPACHATDADFIQTRVDRTFSPFYDKELDARAEFLADRQRGAPTAPPFGPLQPMPLLPP